MIGKKKNNAGYTEKEAEIFFRMYLKNDLLESAFGVNANNLISAYAYLTYLCAWRSYYKSASLEGKACCVQAPPSDREINNYKRFRLYPLRADTTYILFARYGFAKEETDKIVNDLTAESSRIRINLCPKLSGYYKKAVAFQTPAGIINVYRANSNPEWKRKFFTRWDIINSLSGAELEEAARKTIAAHMKNEL